MIIIINPFHETYINPCQKLGNITMIFWLENYFFTLPKP